MAPLSRRRKKALAGPVISDGDRLSALPGDVLRQIVGLLPAQEAVQSSVLARTWRDIWKITDRLFITGESVKDVQEFVDRLLSFRFRSLTEAKLCMCEIYFRQFEEDEDEPRVDSWIRRALQLDTEMLRVDICGDRNNFPWIATCHLPLVSGHLKRLYLYGICFCGSFLKIHSCIFWETKILMSPSLRSLNIDEDSDLLTEWRMRICCPRLVSLRLSGVSEGRTPVLGSMPELVLAHVDIFYGPFDDYCFCDDPMGCHHVMAVGSCSRYEGDDCAEELSNHDDNQDTRNCVLLDGLSAATDLSLISYDMNYIFRRDLRWCPKFSKLNKLLLNDYWCHPADCRALACILEHAPVLETLTVLFPNKVKSKFRFQMKGRFNPNERSAAISPHLRMIEVKCDDVNERVLVLLKFMSARNIWFQIKEGEGF